MTEPETIAVCGLVTFVGLGLLWASLYAVKKRMRYP